MRKETALAPVGGESAFLPATEKNAEMQRGDIFLQKRKKCGSGFHFCSTGVLAGFFYQFLFFRICPAFFCKLRKINPEQEFVNGKIHLLPQIITYADSAVLPEIFMGITLIMKIFFCIINRKNQKILTSVIKGVRGIPAE